MPTTYRRPLIDKHGNTIHPITCTRAVYDDNGKSLEDIIIDSAYRLVVETTSAVISNQVSSATLTAKVYNGSVNVTSSFTGNDYSFVWTRHSTDTAGDTTWNNNPDHYGPGKTSITINEQDILYSATYECALYSND